MPVNVNPTKVQEGDMELYKDCNIDNIVVECATSDHHNESSDDSDDEEYVEESRYLRKPKQVKFLDTVKYATDRSQETPNVFADTLDNESPGGSPDMVCASDEIPVRGDLQLKEVDERMFRYLTSSRDLMPHFMGQM